MLIKAVLSKKQKIPFTFRVDRTKHRQSSSPKIIEIIIFMCYHVTIVTYFLIMIIFALQLQINGLIFVIRYISNSFSKKVT